MNFKGLFVVDENKEQSTKKGSMSKEEIDALLDSNKKNLQSAGVQLETPIFDSTEIVDVNTIYEKTGLADISKSIFKVNEFAAIQGIASLPTEVKRQSVIGILTASGLTIDNLLQDASDRINALADTLETFTAETDQNVDSWSNEINDLQLKIDALKQKTNDRKLLQENESTLIMEETKKVDTIVNFLSPATK